MWANSSLFVTWMKWKWTFLSSQYVVVNRKAEPSVLVMDLLSQIILLKGTFSYWQGHGASIKVIFLSPLLLLKIPTWPIPWMNTCIGFTWRLGNIHLYVWTHVGVLILCKQFGMGTAEWRASKKSSYYDRISYIPGIKVWSSFLMFPLYITQPNVMSI